MRAHCLAAALTLLGAWGCGELEPQVSFPYDPQLSGRLGKDNPAWPSACDRPPAERVGLPVALQLEPTQLPVDHALIQDLVRTVEDLRQPFARLFQRHVCAVVLMHAAPMTGTLQQLDGSGTRGLILLNVDNLTPPDGDWLALKESTVFAPVPGRVLRGTMARPDEQPRRVLLEFLLVHELTHLLEQIYADDPLIEAFKDQSWPRQDALVNTPLVHYPSRKGRAPLPDELLEPYYDLIASGPFASPAAVSNGREDFADSVATFMHTMLRGRPWQLDLYRDGQRVRQLRSCWEEARCAEKRRLIERLLQQWSQQ
ncbi:MAG: hypothetical protein RL033_1866 [Pseudomonadota bacterium]